MQQTTVANQIAISSDEPESPRTECLRPQESPELGQYRVLRLVVSVGECNAAYNQFSLPLRGEYQTTICSFFKSTIEAAEGVEIVEGDGSIRGFLKNVKRLLSQESFDIIHAHSPHVAGMFLLTNLLRRSRMARTVMTAHNSYENFSPRNRLLLIAPFLFFRRVVCCGTAAAASFPWLYRFLAGKRLRSVTNGVNLARIRRCLADLEPRDPTDETFRVVCVGRLIPIKAPVTVLKAFHAATDADTRLTYLGEGKLRGDVEAEMSQLNAADRVELPGIVPREELFHCVYHSDLFVSASLGEGLPIAVLEAMACECPVVLSDIPPHREIANGADFIPLVPVGDEEGFAREIGRFQAMSRAERSEVGRQCRLLVERRFSLEAMHEGYDRLYGELVGQ